jgi:plasmid maintenance system antidote protein VapI
LRISHVVKGARPVPAELALLFRRAFEQSPEYRLNLQVDHDFKVAGSKIGPHLRAIQSVTRVQPASAATKRRTRPIQRPPGAGPTIADG